MKKLSYLFVLSSGMALLLSGCGNNTSKRPNVNSKEEKTLYSYKYDIDTDKFVKDSLTLKTCYFNNSSIPYISLADYTSNFLMENAEFGRLGYTCKISGAKASISLNNNSKFKATATIDVDTQTISYDTYSGFKTFFPDSKYPLYSAIYSGEYLFKDLELETKGGSIFTIDLGKYNLKAYYADDNVFLPYDVCVTAFGSSRDYLVYNGAGYFDLSAYSDMKLTMDMIKSARNAITNKAYDSEYMDYAYDHLAFTFDNFYGLDKRQKRTGNKEEYTYFKNGAYAELEKYKADLKSTQPDVSNNALYNFYNECVNDGGHSGYSGYNIFATKESTILPNGDLFYVNLCTNLLQNARNTAKLSPSKINPAFTGFVETVDNVLFVTMDEFMAKDNGQYTKDQFSDEEYGKSAVTVLGRANEEVQKNKSIKNVVLDMSLNGGGYAYMPMQIQSWINKGNMNFTVKNNKDGTVFKGKGHADVNLDGVFDSKDYLADDIHVYVMCSPASFSSGNYVCCLASEVDGVKFIGERSGGGSCNVDTKNNAFGSSMRTSGDIQLCFNKEKDGKIVSDEDGVIPTFYPIGLDSEANVAKYYDRAAIASKILAAK